MADLKETPRQKMMGILYLVLLGLAATTVTDAVLDAFRNLNVSLKTSIDNVQNTIDNTFKSFEATKLKDDPGRARPLYEKAKKVKEYASDLDSYIESLKDKMIKEGGDMDKSTGDVANRSDVDIAPRIMIRNGGAAELKSKIETTKANILKLLTKEEKAGLQLPLSTEAPAKPELGVQKSWEEVNFGDGIPLTAAITALTKIQADLKNTEVNVVEKILGEADKAVINLDKFDAVAVAPSSYVILGQPYTAQVFLTASDSKSNPTVLVGGSELPIKDGKGVYTVNTSKEGVFTWSGTIRVKQADGTIKEYKTDEQEYRVAKPSAVVSPDKMNVFYIGVDNPVSISAPGIPLDKIKVSISGGSISGSNGKYNVRVSSAGKANVSIAADMGEGKTQTLSTTEFRVKRIPNPVLKFGGKSGGKAATVLLKSQNKLFAMLEDFEFDAHFTVQRFTIIILKPRTDPIFKTVSGNTISGDAAAALSSITPGTRLIFDNVVAKGPDGQSRQLDGMSITAE